ncbi:MAG: glycosyltransferase family 4 protein [Ferruginibacter sp.]
MKFSPSESSSPLLWRGTGGEVKLAIITTHPIQYNAPFFRMLAERKLVRVKVFYTWGESVLNNKYDPGFGKVVAWDIPLLNGYDHCFVKNIAPDPGSHHFNGIDNPTLKKDIEQWGATALLVFGWKFKSHLNLLRHFKGKKTILFRGDSTLLDEIGGLSLKKILRQVFLKWIYRHVDKALYVGAANKEYYLKYGLKNAQLVFAPHAVDNGRFMKNDQFITRAEMGIPPRAIVFTFTGKFEIKKNPQLLLEVFRRLDDPDAHLLFVGSGKLEQTLKSTVEQLPVVLQSRIHFLPFQNQVKMPEIYRLGDVLVLPSRGPGETWGLAVNEAMACSRAVLVSDKCGCAINLVVQGKNGYIFKSGDGDDLLEKMKMLLKDASRLPSMGQRSAKIIQSFSFEKICIAIEQSLR